MMKEPPQPPVITYRLIEKLGARTSRRRNRIARQRREEGTEPLVARIHLDEDAYAGALEAAE
jgi:hypothetical protein